MTTRMQLASGGRFDLANPDPRDVSVDDMATALAHTARFSGHAGPYSVAHHSLVVAELVSSYERLEALIHDAHEAYTGDMITPLYNALPPYAHLALAHLAQRVQTAIRQRLGLPAEATCVLHYADRLALEAERRVFFPGSDWGDSEFIEAEVQGAVRIVQSMRRLSTRGAADQWLEAVQRERP